MPRITLDGLQTHYQQAGDGPDVVLIHAFTSNLSVWMLTSLIETLAADFRVTSYDLRGHGYSSAPPSGYRSAELADDFKKLHAALELGPACLVGHSYGGVIAMHTAALYPEIVRGVILSDSFFPGLGHLEPHMGQAGPWRDLRDTLLEAGVEIGETVDFGRLFRTVAELRPEQLGVIKQKLGAPGARWLSQMARLAETTAGEEAFEVAGFTAERICSVQQPVVALYDEHSPFQQTCAYLEKRLPNCMFDVVPGAKHLAPVQNSAAFVALVQRYLRRMAGRESQTGRAEVRSGRGNEEKRAEGS